jgi:hypothetical protein
MLALGAPQSGQPVALLLRTAARKQPMQAPREECRHEIVYSVAYAHSLGRGATSGLDPDQAVVLTWPPTPSGKAAVGVGRL